MRTGPLYNNGIYLWRHVLDWHCDELELRFIYGISVSIHVFFLIVLHSMLYKSNVNAEIPSAA